jgi:hypothetical protein
MIKRALTLRDALDTYSLKLRVSKDPLDIETFHEDYLTGDEYVIAIVARGQQEGVQYIREVVVG